MSKSRRATVRLHCEALEDRSLPATFYPATAAELVAAVASANESSEADTILLTSGAIYTLTAVNNTIHGSTGLPVIAAAGGPLTIVGNDATIRRSGVTGTPDFRLLAVEAGAVLTAEELTLRNGRTVGWDSWGQGGAVLNRGTLTLRNVAVRESKAEGGAGIVPRYGRPLGGTAAGGGIYSSGTLTVEGGTIQDNQAIGGRGSDGYVDTSSGRRAYASPGYAGGDGLGGGVYVAGGTASLTRVTVVANTARGGDGGKGVNAGKTGSFSYNASSGGNGGNGQGGGLHAAGGTVTLHDVRVTANTATSGNAGAKGAGKGNASNGSPGKAEGGGLYIEAAAVILDSATKLKATGNTARTGDSTIESNIYGPYTVSNGS